MKLRILCVWETRKSIEALTNLNRTKKDKENHVKSHAAKTWEEFCNDLYTTQIEKPFLLAKSHINVD